MIVGGITYKIDDIFRSITVSLQPMFTRKIELLYLSLDMVDFITKYRHINLISMLSTLIHYCDMHVIRIINIRLLKNTLPANLLEQIIEYNEFARSIYKMLTQHYKQMTTMLQNIEQTINSNTLTVDYIQDCINQTTNCNAELIRHRKQCLDRIRCIFNNSNI